MSCCQGCDRPHDQCNCGLVDQQRHDREVADLRDENDRYRRALCWVRDRHATSDGDAATHAAAVKALSPKS